MSQQELWADADKNCNIGVRLGGPLQTAVLDGDNPASVSNIADGLRGMGAPFVCTTTATPGHVHFWLSVTGAPSGESWRKLSQSVGAGEFRFGSGAYVVVPSSIVNGRQYAFVNSTDGPQDIASLRRVHFADLARAFLSDAVARSERIHVTSLPVQLVKRDIPHAYYELLSELNAAQAGQSIGEYESRSEAEFAVVLSAIRAGWDFDEVETLFSEWEPGHYADSENSERYLLTTWNNALDAFASTPTRQKIAILVSNAPRCWPGRGGALDAATYAALLAMGYANDAHEFYASIRDVCELGGSGLHGAYNSLGRLQAAGLVAKSGHDETGGASLWKVGVSIREQKTQYTGSYSADNAGELWNVVGRSAGMIYAELDENEVFCAKILAKTTGKCLNTVKTALAKLARYGLAEKTEGGWIRGKRPLSEAVAEFDGAARAAHRRERHDKERAAWRGRGMCQ